MKKTMNIFKVMVFTLVVGIVFTACVQDDDYSAPQVDDLNNPAAGLVANITIPQLKAQLGAEPTQIVSDLIVKGFVVSSDRDGNFFKELYIQDASTNATSAIRIELEINDLYTQFNVGREIFIKLQGLYIGLGDGDVITIGSLDGDEVGRISENLAAQVIVRSNNTETIVPNVMNLSQINESHIGMMVQVNGAHFDPSHIGQPYVDPFDDFDTQRTIMSCECIYSFSNFILETSTFATFKNQIMPSGSGSITGIITRDFTADNLVMALNTHNDVQFTDSESDKCEIQVLDTSGLTTSFSEDFESMATGTSVSGNGWTNYIEAGSRDWEVDFSTDSGNPSSRIASMGAFSSNSPSNIAWLISPSIDLDAQGIEVVTYETSNSFSDNSYLEVLISTDWDGTPGNITSATWDNVTGCANIVADSEFFQNWVPGSLTLESYSGTAYIAFRYVGGDLNDFTGTYELDNFNVLVE
ncbi:MAG: hypothetical protein HRT68_05580 [Flavobacteriaceae bacterium]|nr:hypothetical protein [Flavobacteriaceae bacterium]